MEALREIAPEPWALRLCVMEGATYIEARHGAYRVYVADAAALERAVAAYDKEFGLPLWEGKDWRVSP